MEIEFNEKLAFLFEPARLKNMIIEGGIYAIINTWNGKIYVGSSYKIKRRGADHFYVLSKNKHPNKHLQAAWNNDKEEAFYFCILERVLDRAELAGKEQAWINKFKSSDPEFGYNKRKIAKNNYGLKASDETKAKLSILHKGVPKSEEHKEKLRKPKSNTENMKGRKLTPEHLKALAASHVGRKVTDEMKAYLSKINTGKPMSEQAKQKLSAHNKGKIIPPEQRALMIANRKLHYENLKKQKENV